MDRVGWKWTEQAVNGQSRLRMDGEGCRWAEEAANISQSRLPRESILLRVLKVLPPPRCSFH